MGKSSPSMPAAPDPTATANAQSAANANTARVQAGLNRFNQITPYSSTTWQQGYTPGYYDGSNPNAGSGSGGGAFRNPPPGQQPTDQSTGMPGRQSQGGASDIPPGYQGQSQGQNQGYHGVFDHYDQYGNQVDSYGSVVQGDQQGGASQGPPGASSSDPNAADQGKPGPQDQWTQTINLSPEEQKLLEQQQGLQSGVLGLASNQLGRIGSAMNQQVNYNGLPQNVTGVDYGSLQSVNPNFARGNIQGSVGPMGPLTTGVDQSGIQSQIGALNQPDPMSVGGPQRSAGNLSYPEMQALMGNSVYQQMASRLDPQWQGNTEQFTQGLADRGIDPTSEQGNRLSTQFNQSKNDAYQSAQNAAAQQSLAEVQGLGGLDLQKYGLQNQAQGQAFGQSLAQNQNIFSQGLQSGQFGNQAQALSFGEGMQNANLNNSAQQQQFGAGLAQAQFANQAQQQDYGQQMGQQQLADQLRSQGLSEQQVNAQLAAYARSQGYTELQNMRLQPITDTQRLLGTGG